MAITSIASGMDASVEPAVAETIKRQVAEPVTVSSLAPARQSAPDIVTTLLAEVASSDLTKLGRILEPAGGVESVKVLDTLLQQAIEQVASGNPGRAVGYLADYATRDPKRAEALSGITELEPVRSQIETLIGRMTSVARMSAEDGLAKAGQSAEDLAGKLPAWDTKADVLVKVAQRLYDAGGYANYSRTSDLTRIVTAAAAAGSATSESLSQGWGTHAPQAMEAAQGVSAAGVMVPGITVPYAVTPYTTVPDPRLGKVSVAETEEERQARRRAKADASELRKESWRELNDVIAHLCVQVWFRAPLFVMLVVWLAAGIVGGIGAMLIQQFAPLSRLATLTSVGFDVWGLGFLALVGFGFWMRVRRVRY